MVIQVVLILGVAIGGGMLMRSSGNAKHQALRRLLLVGFIVVGIVSILVPDVTTRVANAIGVGRGADLVLYMLLVVVLGFIATTYRRFREMERQVTLLTRRLALDEARIEHPVTQEMPRREAGGEKP